MKLLSGERRLVVAAVASPPQRARSWWRHSSKMSARVKPPMPMTTKLFRVELRVASWGATAALLKNWIRYFSRNIKTEDISPTTFRSCKKCAIVPALILATSICWPRSPAAKVLSGGDDNVWRLVVHRGIVTKLSVLITTVSSSIIKMVTSAVKQMKQCDLWRSVLLTGPVTRRGRSSQCRSRLRQDGHAESLASEPQYNRWESSGTFNTRSGWFLKLSFLSLSVDVNSNSRVSKKLAYYVMKQDLGRCGFAANIGTVTLSIRSSLVNWLAFWFLDYMDV